MEKPNLTEDQSLSLLGTNIKIVPKLYVDGSVLNYVLINFDNFIHYYSFRKYVLNTIKYKNIVLNASFW